MVEKNPSDRQAYTRTAGPLLAGLLLLAGTCLTVTARSDESRIPGQLLQNGGAPFTDTVRQMALRDEQFRREVIAGIRPAADQSFGVTRYRWRNKGTQPDGAVFQPTSRSASSADRGALGSPGGNAPQSMGTNFAGIGQQDQIDAFGGSGSYPPDTMGAVGPNHFVELLRGSVAIYDKTGTRLSHVTLNSFFTTGSYPRGNAYSPRVLYDRRSSRWFAIALETNGGTQNHVILAVSANTDPTGTWRKYAITIGEASTTTDEAMLGTDDNGVYIGASMIPTSGSAFGKIAATKKASLLAASPSLSTVYSWRLITDMMATPVPVHNQDAAATDAYAYFLSSSTLVYGNVEYRSLQWALSGVPTLSLTAEVLTSGYGAPLDAPAKDSATDIDVADDRVLMAVQRNGSIWGTRNVGVTSSGGTGTIDRTAAEWFELSTASAPSLGLNQQGRVYDSAAVDPMFYYYPSIVVSGQGHAAMGFSGSNAASYVGAYTAGRLATDGAGTMQSVLSIKAGEASYERLLSGRNRWGNYSATSLDPNDDMSIWTVQEYAASTVANPTNVWGTWIARLLAPAPLITNAAGSAVQGVSDVVLNVTGSRFYDPGTGYPNHINVTLSGDGISDYAITYNSPTSVTAQFDVGLDATIGTRDVTVTNPDGQTAVAAGAFEVLRAIPTTVTVDDVAGVVTETVTLRAVLTNNDTSAGIEGKTLTFKIDDTTVGTGTTAADGAATLAYTIPEGIGAGAQAHSIKASFAFDGIHRPSDGTGTLTVSKADTTMLADDKTAKIGATVSLTATLTRNHDSGAVVGRTVDFKVDGTAVGSDATDASGVATYDYVVPEGAGVGTRTITAEFAGDGDFVPSSDDSTLTVEKGDTQLAVDNVTDNTTASVNLTATLTVVGAGTTLSGKTVDITVDGSSVGTPVTDGSGVASVAYTIPSGMTVGDHTIGAAFAGDANYESTSGSGTLNVNADTTIVATDVSGMVGETKDLNATLTRTDNGTPVDAKTVQFSVDGTSVGTDSTDAAGLASLSYAIPEGGGVGTRTITAAFAGDADYNASSDDATLTVTQGPTKVYTQDRSGTIGANVELRAHLFRITDDGPIAGRTMNFSIDGTAVGSGVTAADGKAIYSWKIDEGAGAGSRTITATFAGDATYSGNTSNGTLTVSSANTLLTGLNRTGTPGSVVQLKAYLRRTTDMAWITGRTIGFGIDGTAVGSAVTNASGMAYYDYTIAVEPGQWSIDLSFAGDAAYNASAGSNTLTVTDTTTLTVDDKAGQIGETVALTATLNRNFDNDPLAGKTVDFSVDGTGVGSGVTDASGVASTNYTIPSGGGLSARTISGSFAGDAVYSGSSDTGTLTVNAADTTTTAADVTGKIHETVNLSATVTRNTDSGAVTGGDVDFKIDGTGVGLGTTDGSGTATYAYAIPEGAGAGSRTITAEFVGNTENNPSSDDAVLTVDKADTTLTINDATGTAGHPVTLSGSLTATPVVGRTVAVKVDGTGVGSAVTDGSGNYSLDYSIPANTAIGTLSLEADFAGDGAYNPSSATGTLTVMSDTNVAVANVAGQPGNSVTLSATLTAANDASPLSGRTLEFKVDGTVVGSGTTDAAGTATASHTVADTATTYTIEASFAGDANYNASSGTGTLSVIPAATSLWTVNRSGIISEQVILRQYDLKRSTDNALLSGKTIIYKIDGTQAGTGTTNAGGDSNLVWVITDGALSRTITTEFAGDATYDPSSASATLTCEVWGTKMVGFNRTVRISGRTELKARLLRSDNVPLYNKDIDFSVDGTFVITRKTNTGGYASYPYYDPPDGAGAGTRTILSTFAGNGSYAANSVTATLTVNKALPYIWVASKSVPLGGTANLYAYFRRLYDYEKQTGKSMDFKVDGTLVQTVVTDGNGVARYLYPTTEGVGSHTITAEFAGDAYVDAGSGSGTLTIY